MLKMNYWDAKWDLDEAQCPCDVQFNEWIDEQKLTGKTIYHFGTGTHHVIGLHQARAGNLVFAITASIEECESYIKLATETPTVSKSYLAYFGDIYLTNARLLPDFDIVTMFHLCEFWEESTSSPEYGGLTDREMLDLFTAKTRPGGYILFYTTSMAYDKAEPVIEQWGKEAPVERVGEFKKLLIYRKRK